MKRILSVLLAAILLLSLSNSGLAEEAREILQSGDFSYAVLEDGTVEITRWYGEEKKLEIPSTLDGKKVTRIGKFAFTVCFSLTTVTIPDSVSVINANPFSCCDKLTSINVSPTHPYFATINGVLYEKATKKLVCYPYAFTAKKFTIPQGITAIGDYAFYSCKSLTAVTIPDSVTSIGKIAFSECDGLTSITIPDSVSEIDANPFWSCDKLTSINVSPTHPYFATIDGVLYEKATKKLVCYPCAFTATEFAIPKGIAVIGDEAFYSCKSLTAVTIPDSVTSIGEDAFYGCSSLTAVTIPGSVTYIGDFAFSNCDSLTTITIPDSVASIGEYAFAGCSRLTAVIIPDSVTSIGNSAFYDCSSLTSVTIPNSVTSIGDDAFYYCSSLTSATIPDSVTSIGKNAFNKCENLTLTVPHDGYAEAYCKENGLRYIFPDTNDWLYN